MICPRCNQSLVFMHTHFLNANYTVRYRVKSLDGGGFQTLILGGNPWGENWHTDELMRLDGLVYLDSDRIERLLILK